MKRFGFALLGVTGTGLIVALTGGSAFAAPVCTDTMDFPSGTGTVTDAFLATSGNCVLAQDKLYSDFNFGDFPTSSGSVNFSLNSTAGVDNHNITFANPFTPSTDYTPVSYNVQISGGVPNNSIVSLLGAILQTTSTTPTTLVTTSTPSGTGSIDISQTGITATGPSKIDYVPNTVTDLMVTVDFSTGAGANATGVQNTIIENFRVPVPEPASLALFGTALAGLGLLRRRRNQAG